MLLSANQCALRQRVGVTARLALSECVLNPSFVHVGRFFLPLVPFGISRKDRRRMSTVSHEEDHGVVVGDNLEHVLGRMRAASLAKGLGREARLVAVSKTKPVADLMAAYNRGQRHFGENYVQELVDKVPQMPSDVQWHFIGHLQSNKAKDVAAIPNLAFVETVDSVKLATALNKTAAKANRTTSLNVLVQVNTSGEDSKSGTSTADALAIVRHVIDSCPLLKFSGLMTIGDPEWDRNNPPNKDFKALVECRDAICRELGIPGDNLELSMGMSDDFEHAIEMGSTNVRVGSLIFGPRAYPNKAK